MPENTQRSERAHKHWSFEDCRVYGNEMAIKLHYAKGVPTASVVSSLCFMEAWGPGLPVLPAEESFHC